MGVEQDKTPDIRSGILEKYIEADPRLKDVISKSREIYDKTNLPNHNFDTHIAQVTYRALVIAESDKLDFSPSVLIAACLLHDIGYSIQKRQEGHEEAGVDVSTKILTESGFNEEEIKNVIQAFTKNSEPGLSIEADVLYDADILNQAGFGSMYAFFVSLYEYRQFPEADDRYDFDDFLNSRLIIADMLEAAGLRTKKGRETLGNGFEERKEFIQLAIKGFSDRPDFNVTFEDLLTPKAN